MKLYTPSTWVLLTVAAVPVANAATCKRLTDATNPFIVGLAQLGGTSVADLTQSSNEVINMIDTHYPWLSTCAASVDVVAVASSLAMNKDAMACVNNLEVMPTITDESSETEGGRQKFVMDQICPYYKDKLVPCVLNHVVKTLVDSMNAGGACCDAMKAEILTDFGSDVASMADTLLKRIGNVLCSTRTYKNAQGSTTTQACTLALFNSMAPSDGSTNPMTQMIQIPSAEVCKAMKGEQYRTTTGGTDQFFWKTANIEPLGICYEPLSALMKTIGDYPIVSTLKWVNGETTMLVSDLFAAGKCVKGTAAMEYFTSLTKTNAALIGNVFDHRDNMTRVGYGSSSGSSSFNHVEEMAGDPDDDLSSKCFHVANGQTCDYGTTTTLTPAYDFATTTATTVKPTTNTTTTNTTTKESSAVTTVTMSLSVLTMMMIGLML